MLEFDRIHRLPMQKRYVLTICKLAKELLFMLFMYLFLFMLSGINRIL